MSDKSGIAEVGKPVQLTWRNRRVTTRENDDGVFFLVQVEVDEETWGFLKTIPRNANGEMVIWVTDIGMVTERPKKERKPKGPKGPYSFMWEYLHPNGRHEGRGFVEIPVVAAAIEEMRETATEPVWEILKRVFGVGSGTLAHTSDKAVLTQFPDNPKVQKAIERAMKFQEEKLKQIANMEGQDG